MPWPAHYLIEWGGRRGQETDEIWQNGVRLAKRVEDGPTRIIGEDSFDGDQTVDSVLLDGWAFAVYFWFRRETSWIATDCMLDWVSAKWVLPNGAPDRAESRYLRYNEDPLRARLADFGYGVPVYGGGILETTHPYQCALWIGWRSDERSAGPGSHGGIYSPAPCMDVGLGHGGVRLEVRESVAASASRLVEDLRYGNSFIDGKRVGCIVSPNGGGVRSPIDTVQVDGRVDVLRKRAAKQERQETLHRVDHDWFDGRAGRDIRDSP